MPVMPSTTKLENVFILSTAEDSNPDIELQFMTTVDDDFLWDEITIPLESVAPMIEALTRVLVDAQSLGDEPIRCVVHDGEVLPPFPQIDPAELGRLIMGEYTLKNRASYLWYEFRRKTSRKFREKDDAFTAELRTAFEMGLLK